MKCSAKNVKIRPIDTVVTTQAIPDFDAPTWLAGQGEPYKYLLAHTFDGIIWGYRRQDGWQLSCDVPGTPSPPLHTAELLELRLFGPTAEIYIWQDEAGAFWSRTIVDKAQQPEAPTPFECYDEPQILWGTKGKPLGNGFVKMEDGSQGMAHAVPLPDVKEAFDKQNVRPVRLCLRHYVARDDEIGMARVTMSRLLDLNDQIEEAENGQQA